MKMTSPLCFKGISPITGAMDEGRITAGFCASPIAAFESNLKSNQDLMVRVWFCESERGGCSTEPPPATLMVENANSRTKTTIRAFITPRIRGGLSRRFAALSYGYGVAVIVNVAAGTVLFRS